MIRRRAAIRSAVLLALAVGSAPPAFGDQPPAKAPTPAADPAVRKKQEELFMVYALEDMLRDTCPPVDLNGIAPDEFPILTRRDLGTFLAERRTLVKSVQQHVRRAKLDDRLLDYYDSYLELLDKAGPFADRMLKREDEYFKFFADLRRDLATKLRIATYRKQAQYLNQRANDALYLAVNSHVSFGYQAGSSLGFTQLGLHRGGGFSVGGSRRVGATYSGRDPYAMYNAGVFSGIARSAAMQNELAALKTALHAKAQKAAEQYEAENKPRLLADLRTITREYYRSFSPDRAQMITTMQPKVEKFAAANGWEDEIGRFDPDSRSESLPGNARKRDPFVAKRKIVSTGRVQSSREIREHCRAAEECLAAADLVPAGLSTDTSNVYRGFRAQLVSCAGYAANRGALAELGTGNWLKAGKLPSDSPSLPRHAWEKYRTDYGDTRSLPKVAYLYQTAIAHACNTEYDAAGLLVAERMLQTNQDRENVRATGDPEFFFTCARLCSLRPRRDAGTDGRTLLAGFEMLECAAKLGHPRLEDAASSPDFDRLRTANEKRFKAIVTRQAVSDR